MGASYGGYSRDLFTRAIQWIVSTRTIHENYPPELVALVTIDSSDEVRGRGCLID